VTVITIFFITLITAFAVVAFFTEPTQTDKKINTRLAALDRKRGPAADDELDILRDVTFSTIPALDKFLRKNRVAIGLCLLIEQSGLHWTVGRVVFSTLAVVCVAAALGQWWIAPGLLGWLPALALGASPYLFLLRKREQRFRRITGQLPAAIDLMSGGLRAGQAVLATIETVAEEVDEPLRAEFRHAAVELNFGLPFREAMLNFRSRVPVPDVQFLIAAILVQKETGGNLAVILDKTSHVIRERLRVAGELRVRTAQGRLTGWMLSSLPFVIFIGLNILHPGYGRVLFVDPLGQKLVIAAGLMMGAGILIIRKMVSVGV
jgi:tight adherence protein B